MTAADDTVTVVAVVMMVRMTETALTRAMVTTANYSVASVTGSDGGDSANDQRTAWCHRFSGALLWEESGGNEKPGRTQGTEGTQQQEYAGHTVFLLHAGSKTAGITDFAVSTAFLNINSLRPRSSGGDHSCRPNPSPAADSGWASLGGKKAVLR